MNLHVPLTQTQQLGKNLLCVLRFSFFSSALLKSILKQIPDLQLFPSYMLHIHLQKIMGISSHYQNAIKRTLCKLHKKEVLLHLVSMDSLLGFVKS